MKSVETYIETMWKLVNNNQITEEEFKKELAGMLEVRAKMLFKHPHSKTLVAEMRRITYGLEWLNNDGRNVANCS